MTPFHAHRPRLRPARWWLALCLLPAAWGTAAAEPRPADLWWLDRLTWGATPQALDDLQHQGRAAWLQAQLAAPAVDRVPPAVAERIAALPLLTGSLRDRVAAVEALRPVNQAAQMAAQMAAKAPMAASGAEPGDAAAMAAADAAAAQKAFRQHLRRTADEAATRSLLRAAYSPDQVREQMVWFWMNHFSVNGREGVNQAWLPDYEQRAIRPFALGRFRDLLEAVVTHPAMLIYLNNTSNAAGKVNENLARELMELHTLGVDGGYTQADVQSLALVLTGLGVDVKNGLLPPEDRPAPVGRVQRVEGFTVFAPARHDTSQKLLLGQALPGPGWRDVETALDLLARHPATARHVSRQLARHFVGDTPPAALVARMAERFTATDGDIAQVLKVMFTAPEFEASLDRRFKMPVQYVLSTVRLLWPDPAQPPDLPRLLNGLERLGQPLYGRATPDGYPPDAAYWNGSGQMGTRFELARQWANAAMGTAPTASAASGAVPSANGEPLRERPDQTATALLAPTLSPQTRATLAEAATPRERLTLLLASPEFMTR